MTTTPEPRPGAGTSGPDARPTQELPATGAPAPQEAAPRLTPAQHWARYESMQRAAQQQTTAGPQPGTTATAVLDPAPSAAPAVPGGPGVPPNGSPWAAPNPPEAPRRRGRAWLWVTLVVVAALVLVGGVVGVGLTVVRNGGTDQAASLSDVGRPGADPAPVEGSTVTNPDWPAVVAAVQDSVVAIEVRTQNGGGQGSGVVIDEEHVLTNDHVVAAAEGNVQVTLTDGRILEGEVIGTDTSTDLAVVRLVDAPEDLQPAALGDSDEVTVGEPVMAVGNPLGLANTVTTGIVSAVDRPVSTQGTDGGTGAVTNAIQVDAAINPGNSGGPLFDASGRVIGITSSIATLSQASGSIGLGFAIPVNLARDVAGQLVEDGVAEHAYLGVTLSDGTATADGVTRRGAVVESVQPDSPAAGAGIRQGDVVVEIDDDPVGGAESLTAFVRQMSSGDDVTLTLVRGGKAVEVEVTLATRPDDADLAPQQPEQPRRDEGQPGGLPEGMSPGELWEWLQQQRDR